MYKVLILAKYFAPQQGIGSVRWTKIAKYLTKLGGYDISLLTETRNFYDKNSLIHLSKKDELLERDLKYISHCYEIRLNLLLKLYYTLRKRFQRSRKYGGPSTEVIHERPVTLAKKMKKEFYIFALDILDMLWAQNIVNFCKTMNLQAYDVIISSNGPFWSSIAAGRLKKENPKIVWIADFRDPYACEEDTPLSYQRHKRNLYKYCKNADVILRASSRMKTNTPSYVPRETITNGYDSEEYLPPLKSDRFCIVYTGTMYPANNMKPICRAVRELSAENRLDRNDISIDFFGEGGFMAEKQAAEEGISEIFHNHGLVSRSAVLEKQRSAAILLQMSRNTRYQKIDWTGKMYEYMMMKKPVIYTLSGDVAYSYPSRHMNQLGGCCYETCRDSETFPYLKSYILKKYDEWKAQGYTSVTRDESYVLQYSYAEIAKKMDTVIQKHLNKDEMHERDIRNCAGM